MVYADGIKLFLARIHAKNDNQLSFLLRYTNVSEFICRF